MLSTAAVNKTCPTPPAPTTEFYVRITLPTDHLINWARDHFRADTVSPEVAASLFSSCIVPPFSLDGGAHVMQAQFVALLMGGKRK